MDNREYFELNRKQWLYKRDNGRTNRSLTASFLFIWLKMGG